MLTRGSGVSEGKCVSMSSLKEPFRKRKRRLLKNEYGWGGSYPVIIGAGIDETTTEKVSRLQRVSVKTIPHYSFLVSG